MKKMNNWLFPLIAVIIFATLFGVMLAGTPGLPLKTIASFGAGLLAFSLMLTQVFIALRPKFIERKKGLPGMYHIHAWIGLVLVLVVVLHVISRFNGFRGIGAMSVASRLGFLGVTFLAVTVTTGIFALSNTFIKNSRTLMRWKDKVFKREISLWLHRMALLAVITIDLHVTNAVFFADNPTFKILINVYTAVAIGAYLISKIRQASLPRYNLKRVTQLTPTIYELDFQPMDRELMKYQPGQYVFVRFVDSAMPRESHPFSISSAPTTDRDSLQVMVKNSGDYTSRLDRLNPGDQATLAGPYGNFTSDNVAQPDTPLVMLAGGIGLTPIISIIRDEMANNSTRRIELIWALAREQDLMLLAELEAMKKQQPNFDFHLIFSREEVAHYAHGHVSAEFLQTIGVNEIYGTAEFFICGPPPMMKAVKQLLQANNVDEDKIHIEVFAF